MPFQKKGNSRDDKSKKPSDKSHNRSSKSNERPAENNKNFKKKPFESDGKRPFKKEFKESAKPRVNSSFDRNKPEREGRTRDRFEDKKTFGKEERPERKFAKKDSFFDRNKPENRNKPEREGRTHDRFEDKKTFGKEERPERKFAKKDSFTERKSPYDKDKGFKSSPSRGDKKPFTDQKFSKKTFGDKPFRSRPNYEKDQSSWSTENRGERSDRSQPNHSKKTKPKKEDNLIRLNRYIANAGICSRRKADDLIAAGTVSVNGEAVSELGFKVDPSKDVIRYNGETLKREKMVYVLLNKPKDYITTTDDPQERKTVMNLVEKATNERIYPVGRLDRNTTGLLLLTNDGDLAEKLSHPRNHVTKIYQVELNKNLTQGDLNKIAFGLELEDGIIKPDEVTYVSGGSKKEIGIQIHSGKNRIVRRIFEHLGYEVEKLDRVIYANLTKKDLPRGRWRYLEEREIIQLKHLIQVNKQ